MVGGLLAQFAHIHGVEAQTHVIDTSSQEQDGDDPGDPGAVRNQPPRNLEAADLGGLDIFHAVGTYLVPRLSSEAELPAVLTDLVEKGKLGAKSGSGFYSYPGKAFDEMIRRRDRVLLEFLKALRADS